MASFFEKFDKSLMWVLGVIVFVASLTMTALILFLVMARFIFGWSVVGILELATLSAIWLYMCGAVVAARNREHLVVDFLSHSLKSARHRAWHNLAVSLVMVVLSLFFIGLADDMLAWSMKRPQTTAALGLPLLIPQSAIILASGLFAIYTVRDAVRAALVVFRGADDSKSESEGA